MRDDHVHDLTSEPTDDELRVLREAAGRAAFHADNPHVYPVTTMSELFQCVALQEVDAKIGRDAVKATTMHNPRTAFDCVSFMPQLHFADPLRLAC